MQSDAATRELVLSGRSALVTGAGSGIGRECSLALARLGARVIAVGRRAEPLAETVAAIEARGGRGAALAADIGADAFLGRLDALEPRIDVWVNSAVALAAVAPLEELSDEDLARLLAVDLVAPIRIARHLVGGMKRRGFGRMVLLGSIAASTGCDGQAAYAAAKAGLAGLVKSLAAEAGAQGVTCNLVEPGLVDTERIQARLDPTLRARLLSNIPAGRAGTSLEVADLIAFLCTPGASYVNGAVIPASGGFGLGLYSRPPR